MELAGDRIWDYTVDSHSCIVNGTMEHYARPERGKAQDAAQKKKPQPEP